MPPAELNRVLYRSIFRWAKASESVPFTLKGSDVAEVLPTLSNTASLPLDDSEAVVRLTRSGFRAHQELQDENEASEALEAGLRGLRLLSSHYRQQVDDLKSQRSLHLDKRSVEYAVGQVFEHKKFGYRGVIYGWDAICGREPGWAEALDLERHQPFYKVLPDEDDCQKVFGSIRMTKYVAQENVTPVTASRRVTHRALEEYFAGYSPSTMRYIPTRQLQYQYPDCYDAPDTVSCREDTNILRLGEEGGRSSHFASHFPEWLEEQPFSSELKPE